METTTASDQLRMWEISAADFAERGLFQTQLAPPAKHLKMQVLSDARCSPVPWTWPVRHAVVKTGFQDSPTRYPSAGHTGWGAGACCLTE
ncbi:protein of unknown function [Paraburkholderia kururiensis]